MSDAKKPRMVIQEMNRAFECKECGRTYKQLSNLIRHRKDCEQREGCYICPYKCGRSLVSDKALGAHISKCVMSPFYRKKSMTLPGVRRPTATVSKPPVPMCPVAELPGTEDITAKPVEKSVTSTSSGVTKTAPSSHPVSSTTVSPGTPLMDEETDVDRVVISTESSDVIFICNSPPTALDNTTCILPLTNHPTPFDSSSPVYVTAGPTSNTTTTAASSPLSSGSPYDISATCQPVESSLTNASPVGSTHSEDPLVSSTQLIPTIITPTRHEEEMTQTELDEGWGHIHTVTVTKFPSGKEKQEEIIKSRTTTDCPFCNEN